MPTLVNLKSQYSPLYYLAALGAGGISHGSANMWHIPFIILAIAGIVYFSYQHILLLIWNIREFKTFKTTDTYEKLSHSNGEVSLMAMPLTYAMSINVGFVLGATFVPGLWNIIEWLFPGALVGFLAVGIYALRIYGRYFTRLMVKANFSPEANNNFSQLLAIFAFSMIAVGFAAPGAMSGIPLVSAIGIFGAIFFSVTAIGLGVLKIIFAMRDIFAQGINAETSVSLWVMIPILTLLGITAIRITFGVAHNFMGEHHAANWVIFLLTSTILALQLIFGWIGYKVMKEVGYFKTYIHGDAKSPVSFAIICPGVAFFVFGVFFIMLGLVANNIVSLYSPLFYALFAALAWVQWLTIKTFWILRSKLLYM